MTKTILTAILTLLFQAASAQALDGHWTDCTIFAWQSGTEWRYAMLPGAVTTCEHKPADIKSKSLSIEGLASKLESLPNSSHILIHDGWWTCAKGAEPSVFYGIPKDAEQMINKYRSEKKFMVRHAGGDI